MNKHAKTLVALLIVSIFLVLASGCSKPAPKFSEETASGTKLVNGKPHWYWQPGDNGRIGGVGVSLPHIRGISFQRELAVRRAIDDIARQLGVNVDSVAKIQASVENGNARTRLDTYSIQTVDGKTVTATVQEFWEDPRTRELYVWMLAN